MRVHKRERTKLGLDSLFEDEKGTETQEKKLLSENLPECVGKQKEGTRLIGNNSHSKVPLTPFQCPVENRISRNLLC